MAWDPEAAPGGTLLNQIKCGGVRVRERGSEKNSTPMAEIAFSETIGLLFFYFTVTLIVSVIGGT
jgi:hypothetical protein